MGKDTLDIINKDTCKVLDRCSKFVVEVNTEFILSPVDMLCPFSGFKVLTFGAYKIGL